MLQGNLESKPESKPKKKRREKCPPPKPKDVPNATPVKTNPMERVSAPNMPTDLNFSLDQAKHAIEAGE